MTESRRAQGMFEFPSSATGPRCTGPLNSGSRNARSALCHRHPPAHHGKRMQLEKLQQQACNGAVQVVAVTMCGRRGRRY